MNKKQRKKLHGGETIVFRLPTAPNKKVLDFLNEARVSRSKKINEALEYYVENKEIIQIISEIKSDLKRILEEISSAPKDVQAKKSSKSIDAEKRLILNIKNTIDKIDKMK